MHINLIFGFIFVLAVWWLLHEMRAGKKNEPASMLKDEMEKRRAAQEQRRHAGERLAALKNERLDTVMEALTTMLASVKSEGFGIGAQRGEDCLNLFLGPPEQTEAIRVEWNVKNFDLELFSSQESLKNVRGDYIVHMPGGALLRETHFDGLMRALSGLIADKLV